MNLGVIVRLDDLEIDARFKEVHDFGFRYCQLVAWKHEYLTDETAEMILEACSKYDVKISTFWCGWSGPASWNFYDGPITLGLVPQAYRFVRTQELINGSDFAKKLGVDKVATHAGFLPENLNDVDYSGVVCALRQVANHCKANGQKFLFETGQETPVTLLRLIEDIGTDNLGINLDPANLLMYGKANPTDALDVFGKYVVEVHAKDGDYPTDGRNLGKEYAIGQGRVNFPVFVEKLKEIGFDGVLIIEREIVGEQQSADIRMAKTYLEGLI